MSSSEKVRLKPEDYVTNLEEALAVSTHQNRERMIWWVLCPLLVVSVAVCLVILVADAWGCIKPLGTGELSIIGVILGGDVLGFVMTAGFGWLFKSSG